MRGNTGWVKVFSLSGYRQSSILRRTRFVEIDTLRGICILSMVILHLWWDLEYFGILKVDRFFYKVQHVFAPLFFVIMGMCLVITYSQYKHGIDFYRRSLIRGLYIFALGMVLSMFSIVFIPDRPIYFGVLHCIGVCIILCIPFLRLGVLSIVFSVLFICIGFILGSYPMDNFSLIHVIIGVHPSSMHLYTVDYFPLFPWLGVALLGVAIGSILYKDGRRQFSIPDLSSYKPLSAVSWLGRHSLVVYLIHQPVIAGFIQGFLYLSRVNIWSSLSFGWFRLV